MCKAVSDMEIEKLNSMKASGFKWTDDIGMVRGFMKEVLTGGWSTPAYQAFLDKVTME